MSTDSRMVRATVTRWPHVGDPEIIAGPWAFALAIGEGVISEARIPMREGSWDGIGLHLRDVVPAAPGWYAAIAMLTGSDGRELGQPRPVMFYGRPSDVGSHLYFHESWVGASFSVHLQFFLDDGG